MMVVFWRCIKHMAQTENYHNGVKQYHGWRARIPLGFSPIRRDQGWRRNKLNTTWTTRKIIRNSMMTWKLSLEWSRLSGDAEVDRLHVERNRLVGINYFVTSLTSYTWCSCCLPLFFLYYTIAVPRDEARFFFPMGSAVTGVNLYN
jgi:hypothetical protein